MDNLFPREMIMKFSFLRQMFLVVCVFLFLGTPVLFAEDAKPVDMGKQLGLVGGQHYFLGHNLHADNTWHKVSTANFQLRGGLLSWGTPVKITKITSRYLIFIDLETKTAYRYVFHGRTIKAKKLKFHFSHVFVKDLAALKARYAGLSEVDKDGIFEGVAKIGMSKTGVLMALGYPPEYVTPTPMKSREWLYWQNRLLKIYITFNRQGRVALIK